MKENAQDMTGKGDSKTHLRACQTNGECHCLRNARSTLGDQGTSTAFPKQCEAPKALLDGCRIQQTSNTHPTRQPSSSGTSAHKKSSRTFRVPGGQRTRHVVGSDWFGDNHAHPCLRSSSKRGRFAEAPGGIRAVRPPPKVSGLPANAENCSRTRQSTGVSSGCAFWRTRLRLRYIQRAGIYGNPPAGSRSFFFG